MLIRHGGKRLRVQRRSREEEEKGDAGQCIASVVKCEKIKKQTALRRGDPYNVMIKRIRTPLGHRAREGRENGVGGREARRTKKTKCENKKKIHFIDELTFCHTKTLWTIAHPQNTMPRPIKTDVTIAGVEWN